eukprot:21109-Chlamydomonas_euryale.AAC.1
MSAETALMPSMAERAAFLLQAIVVRSMDGRKRIINEVVATLMLAAPPSDAAVASASAGASAATAAAPGASLELTAKERAMALAPVDASVAHAAGAYTEAPGSPHPVKARVFVALLATLVQPTPTNMPPTSAAASAHA